MIFIAGIVISFNYDKQRELTLDYIDKARKYREYVEIKELVDDSVIIFIGGNYLDLDSNIVLTGMELDSLETLIKE